MKFNFFACLSLLFLFSFSETYSMLCLLKQTSQLSHRVPYARHLFLEVGAGVVVVGALAFVCIPPRNELYKEVAKIGAELGGQKCSDAYTSKTECKNVLCCKKSRQTGGSKREIAHSIKNKRQSLERIQSAYVEIVAAQKKAITLRSKGTLDNEEYKKIMGLIEHKKGCLDTCVTSLDAHMDRYFEVQETLYLDKLQEKQQTIRDLAHFYATELKTEQQAIEELLLQLRNRSEEEKKRKKEQNCVEESLYAKSLSSAQKLLEKE